MEILAQAMTTEDVISSLRRIESEVMYTNAVEKSRLISLAREKRQGGVWSKECAQQFGIVLKNLEYASSLREARTAFFQNRASDYTLHCGSEYGSSMGLVSITPTFKVVQMDCGGNHYIARDERGLVYAWGQNAYGQLLTGNDMFSNTPVHNSDFSNRRATWVSAGYCFSIVCFEDGTRLVAGCQEDGRLGNGKTDEDVVSGEFVRDGFTFTNIASGSMHCLALDSKGSVYSWGSGHYNGRGVTSGTPRRLEGIPRAHSISVSMAYHSLVVTLDGKLYAFGAARCGQLGISPFTLRTRMLHDNTSTVQPTPRCVLSGNVVAACAGWGHSMVLLTGDRIKCCGRNVYGAAGSDPSDSETSEHGIAIQSTFQEVPLPIQGRVTSFSAAVDRCTVILDRSKVVVWGHMNENGLAEDWDWQPRESRRIAFPVEKEPRTILNIHSGSQSDIYMCAHSQ